MTIKTRVEAMSEQRERNQQGTQKRKAALSPELTEFLHMLKSLETALDTQAAPSR